MSQANFGTPRGPTPAHFLIVGEAFGEEEARQRVPFVGPSGQELGRMLQDAGIASTSCRYTNVVNLRPPGNDIEAFFASSKKAAQLDGLEQLAGKYPRPVILQGIEQLREEITKCQPLVIIAVGNTALWALTGEWGITNWRGSKLDADGPVGTFPGITVVPTYHPAAILRAWHWRHIAIHDLRYAKLQAEHPTPEPDYEFHVRPTYEQTIDFLRFLEDRLQNSNGLMFSADTETRGGQIACLGLGWEQFKAFCIPFQCVETPSGYWTVEQETEIVWRLRRILTHRNAEPVWQNGIYDLQYTWHDWRFIAHVKHDTMLMQHAAFPGLPRGLDFLHSMYSSYRRYWKEEGKLWDPRKTSEDQLWTYNCKDCSVTLEIVEPLSRTLDHLNCWPIYAHSLSLYEPVLFMMLNGVRIDTSLRAQMAFDLTNAIEELQDWFKFILGAPLNVNSAQQMRRLFYDDIGIPVMRNRKTGSPTLDAKALAKIPDRFPILAPLVERILLRRSIGVFHNTFIKAQLDPDTRMRCSYNIAGTETGRFSSSQNAHGRGTNLENIPRPPEKHEAETTPIVRLPNVRQMFVPDPGMVIADFDLDRADAHIVAWEAGDETLKTLFRSGADIHQANADVLKISRQLAKTFVHGTNYGGRPKTMAGHCGITIAEAERGQRIWFEAHPAIQEWHHRVEFNLQTKRQVTTVFSRVRYYFDRIDFSIVHQALAYLGQSPVADVINKGLRNVYDTLPWCQLLLQNHDSIVVQFPADNIESRIADITECLRIPIPYEDELIIPVGCKYSLDSWGTLQEWKGET